MRDIDATRLTKLRKNFKTLYSRDAQGIVRAPGRVNLIGEHTDYNGGFVLPIAIERCTLAAWALRDDTTVNFASAQADRRASIDLNESITPSKPTWANYCKGVAAGLAGSADLAKKLRPMDILFDSDVPIGSGLSSSASLEVATAVAMLTAAGLRIDDYELALICQKAEHEFAGAPCGIMDQSIAIMARTGNALLLDCRSGQSRQVPFDDADNILMVADTQVSHDLTDGGYAARRDQSHSAAEKLGVKTLREVGCSCLDKLSGKELMRARHVIGEIGRTLQAVEAMEAKDYSLLGQLMYDSHKSLRDDYEVSCEELDAIVEVAKTCPGVYGARMTGGGFGGCAIILARPDKAEAIAKTVADQFAASFGRMCPIFTTRATGGAGIVA